jgi:hypothetical protein
MFLRNVCSYKNHMASSYPRRPHLTWFLLVCKPNRKVRLDNSNYTWRTVQITQLLYAILFTLLSLRPSSVQIFLSILFSNSLSVCSSFLSVTKCTESLKTCLISPLLQKCPAHCSLTDLSTIPILVQLTFPSSLIHSTVMMEAILSSETSATRTTRRHIPEDGILHSHCRENLKSYTYYSPFSKMSNLSLILNWSSKQLSLGQ